MASVFVLICRLYFKAAAFAFFNLDGFLFAAEFAAEGSRSVSDNAHHIRRGLGIGVHKTISIGLYHKPYIGKEFLNALYSGGFCIGDIAAATSCGSELSPRLLHLLNDEHRKLRGAHSELHRCSEPRSPAADYCHISLPILPHSLPLYIIW